LCFPGGVARFLPWKGDERAPIAMIGSMIHDNLQRSIDDLSARMQNIRDSL
jgi:hypothetical protein